jgi:hypothetical protein
MAIERNVLHVNQARPADGDGTTWATAFKYLQSALAVAVPGQEIHVAEGTYLPDEGPTVIDNDRNATFQLRTAVTLYGGFPATGNPGFAERDPASHPTVLSGDIDGNDTPDFGNRTGNSLHVVIGSGAGWSAVLDGFTIRAGFIDTTYGGGAGMFNSNGSPTVRNCLFEDGSGTNSGGIFNDGNSPARIENCLFRNNRASNAGGAIRNNQAGANARISNCRFENNWSRWAGGAIYNFHASPLITDCIFLRNDSDGFGGGAIHGDQPASRAQVVRCTFEDNTAPDGGALYNRRGAVAEVRESVFLTNAAEDDGGAVFDSGGTFRLINCRFLANAAGGDGGAVCGLGTLELLLANCAAGGNAASGKGGVLFGGAGTPAVLANCSLSRNQALAGGACLIDGSGATLNLANSICWQNTAPTGPQLGVQNAGVITVGHCLLEGGLAAIHSTATVNDGGNNLMVDPQFVDADGADNLIGTSDDDLKLPITSPALDGGNNAAVPAGVTTDLAGLPRLVDGDKNGTTTVDLGAYEYYNNPDMDGDGLLDSWEQQLIDANPNDGITTYAEVDPNADYDNDGLANKDEYARTTSPLNPDCDGDSLTDGAEVHTHSTNPLAADTDADKFGDAIEISHGMNPNASDASLFNHVTAIISSSAIEMSAAGLYTEAAIRNLYVGTPLLAVDLAAAEVAIDLRVEWSDSLTTGSWQPYDFSSPDWTRSDTGWLHHTPDSHCFYRIFLGERPGP